LNIPSIILTGILLCLTSLHDVCSQPIDGVFIRDNVHFVEKKYRELLTLLDGDNFEPRRMSTEGKFEATGVSSWTSGYFTGGLWLLYHYTGKKEWEATAKEKTFRLLNDKTTGLQAIGYITCMQNALKIDPEQKPYKEAIIKSAQALTMHYNSRTGMIRVWNGRPHWNFPAIVDFLSNLEALFRATVYSGDSAYASIAFQFANNALEHHIRADFSTAQVAEYDSTTGNFLGRRSYQGLNNGSTWSRGQAWSIDGLTEIYRLTEKQVYLDAAKNVSDFFIDNLPEDHIPYWDFDDPDIPGTYRDASAAALACSGLLELYDITQENKYRAAAEQILLTLSSSRYQTVNQPDNPFVLQHCVGNLPHGKEIDVSLVYADYYYLEALIKYYDFIM